jgi:peptide deformylase
MKRKILTYPNDIEILSLKSQEVTDLKDEAFKQLIQDLKDTLQEDPTGVGLSAIQIGIPLRVCIINYGKEIIMINPIIT